MSKTVSATEVKNKLGAVVSWVLENHDEVIVESRGEPTVVIMPFAEYERVNDLREQDRINQAFARLQKARDEVRAQNPDITTEEQALAVADEIARAVIDRLVETGQVRFEQDRQDAQAG